MPEMTYHIIDLITNLKKVVYGTRNKCVRLALNKTDSEDPEYISKVIDASRNGQEDPDLAL